MEQEDLLRLRNDTQLGVNRGDYIDDPVFLNALKKAGEGRKVEEFGGDYFETILPKSKKEMATGRVVLKPVERSHGLGTSAATYQAMSAAESLARTGKSKITPGAGAKNLPEIASFLQKHVMPGSITQVGTKGSRGNATDEQILLRAAALFGDTYNGFDPRHGMPFNMMKGQTGVVGRDAGHFIGHASRPDLSNDPYNIGYQNQYENKGQSAAEKIASQEGRVATGTEIADMLWKSIVNRTVEDVKLPSRNTKVGKAAYEALMGPINAKLDQSRMAGQIFIV